MVWWTEGQQKNNAASYKKKQQAKRPKRSIPISNDPIWFHKSTCYSLPPTPTTSSSPLNPSHFEMMSLRSIAKSVLPVVQVGAMQMRSKVISATNFDAPPNPTPPAPEKSASKKVSTKKVKPHTMLVFFKRAGCDTFSLEVEETSTVASLVEAAARALDTEADSIVLHYGADAAPLLEVTALEEGCTVVVETSPRVVAEAELRRRGCEVSKNAVYGLILLGERGATPHANLAELLPLYIETKCAPQEALYAAAVGDDVASMRRLIAEGADIDECSRYFHATALVYAAMVGSVGCVRLALEEGADLNATISDQCYDGGYTAAHCAAQAGHVECLRLLIEAGCDLTLHADLGSTALSVAASCGHADCMQLLLDHKPTYTYTYGPDRTLLMVAASSGDPECLRIAFNAETPNLTQTDRNNKTAEDIAREEGHSEAFAAALEAYNATKLTKKCKMQMRSKVISATNFDAPPNPTPPAPVTEKSASKKVSTKKVKPHTMLVFHDNLGELLPLYIETKCAPQEALYAAAVGDDVASMRRLIAEGANIVETCDVYGVLQLWCMQRWLAPSGVCVWPWKGVFIRMTSSGISSSLDTTLQRTVLRRQVLWSAFRS